VSFLTNLGTKCVILTSEMKQQKTMQDRLLSLASNFLSSTISVPRDWQRVKVKELRKFVARKRGRIPHINQDPREEIIHSFPEFNFAGRLWKLNQKTMTKNVPQRFPLLYYRSLLFRIGEEERFEIPKDNYRLKFRDFEERGIAQHQRPPFHSPVSWVISTLPEILFEPWEWSKAPNASHSITFFHKKCLEKIAPKLKIRRMEDWYSQTMREISMLLESEGKSISHHYSGSLYQMLCSVYPQHSWIEWKFKYRSFSLDCLRTQREYLVSKGEDLGVCVPSDWYNLARFLVRVNKLTPVFSSIYQAVISLQPELPIQEWRFLSHRKHKLFWKKKENVMVALEAIMQEFEMTSLHDWYLISHQDIDSTSGIQLIKEHKTLFHLLSIYYPQHKWNQSEFRLKRDNLKSESRIYTLISNHFHQFYSIEKRDILHNFFHSWPGESKKQVELDIYLPSLSLAFEYQGKHHYEDHFLYGRSRLFQTVDHEKQKLCQEAGIHLIQIPYWQAGKKEIERSIQQNVTSMKSYDFVR